MLVDNNTAFSSAGNWIVLSFKSAKKIVLFCPGGGGGGGLLSKNIGYGCAARFSNRLPYLWLACRLIYDQSLPFSLPYLWPINDLTKNFDTLFMTRYPIRFQNGGQWLKSIYCLWPERLKNPTLWGRTYLYNPYKGVPPGCFVPQHGRLVMWLQAKNTRIFQDFQVPYKVQVSSGANVK